MSRGRNLQHLHIVAARTVAVRGSPVSIDISPKKPPACDRGHLLARRLEHHVTAPRSTTNIELPASPWRTMASPAANRWSAASRGQLAARRRRGSGENKSMPASCAAAALDMRRRADRLLLARVLDLDRPRNLDVGAAELVPEEGPDLIARLQLAWRSPRSRSGP